MNLPPIQPPLTRDPALNEFNRRVAERLQQLQMLESSTIQINHTSNGMSAEVKDLGGGAATPSSDPRWS